MISKDNYDKLYYAHMPNMSFIKEEFRHKWVLGINVQHDTRGNVAVIPFGDIYVKNIYDTRTYPNDSPYILSYDKWLYYQEHPQEYLEKFKEQWLSNRLRVASQFILYKARGEKDV